MSTILDALRKLQRDREKASQARSLRETATGEFSTLPGSRRRRPRSAVIALLLVCVGGLGVLVYELDFWRSPRQTADEASLAPETPVAETPQPAQARPPEAVRQRAATKARGLGARQHSKIETAMRRPLEGGGEAAAEPPACAHTDAVEHSGPKGKTEPASGLEAAARAAPRKRRPPRNRVVPGKPGMSGRRKPAPAVAQKSTPESAKVVAQAKPEPAPKPAPATSPRPAVQKRSDSVVESPPQPAQPLTRENPFLETFEPVTKVEPIRSPGATATAAGAAGEPTFADADFPALELSSVRWHPDPSRRTASMVVDGVRRVSVREGDIVQGAMVHRIDPGAIELRVGTARERLQLGP